MTQRLFIIAEPRSGSSWLLETLNTHDNISKWGELYNHTLHKEILQFRQIRKKTWTDVSFTWRIN